MVTHDDIREALRGVLDPEMPISIVDLGLVERIDISGQDTAVLHDPAQAATGAAVRVDILPTFVGCPALDMIRNDICRRVGDLPGVAAVHVRFLNDPLWSTDRITPAGRASLREHGVTVPENRTAVASATRTANGGSPSTDNQAETLVPLTVRHGDTAQVACPYCGSDQTVQESRFGPTRCRMIYYCKSCKNSFEQLKRV